MGNLMIPVFLPVTIEDIHLKLGGDVNVFFFWTTQVKHIFARRQFGNHLNNQTNCWRVNNSTPPKVFTGQTSTEFSSNKQVTCFTMILTHKPPLTLENQIFEKHAPSRQCKNILDAYFWRACWWMSRKTLVILFQFIIMLILDEGVDFNACGFAYKCNGVVFHLTAPPSRSTSSIFKFFKWSSESPRITHLADNKFSDFFILRGKRRKESKTNLVVVSDS